MVHIDLIEHLSVKLSSPPAFVNHTLYVSIRTPQATMSTVQNSELLHAFLCLFTVQSLVRKNRKIFTRWFVLFIIIVIWCHMMYFICCPFCSIMHNNYTTCALYNYNYSRVSTRIEVRKINYALSVVRLFQLIQHSISKNFCEHACTCVPLDLR